MSISALCSSKFDVNAEVSTSASTTSSIALVTLTGTFTLLLNSCKPEKVVFPETVSFIEPTIKSGSK